MTDISALKLDVVPEPTAALGILPARRMTASSALVPRAGTPTARYARGPAPAARLSDEPCGPHFPAKRICL